MTDNIDIRRRALLAGGAGAVAAAALLQPRLPAMAQDAKPAAAAAKPLPDYVKWKNPDALIVHSDQTIETRRSFIGTGVVTPDEHLFIRNNVKAPDDSFVADRDGWSVAIGGVKNSRSLTVAELKGMGLATVAMVLQCSGNGRGFFMKRLAGTDKKISGTPWTVGAAGCVIWSGVPLKTVVEALGGQADGVKYVTGTGGEKLPEGINPKDVMVERSVPLGALDRIILAWEMNGKPVSLAHGGPLRMIVPGYTGVNNVKYVKAVTLTAEQSDAKIQKTGYRMHSLDEKGAPSQPSVWEMEVKSWITSPIADGKAGRTLITGVAFGGGSPVKSVEVSTDGGANWKKAEFFGPDLGPYAWRQFALAVDLKPGAHTIVSRATDEKGAAQPREVEINGSGYNNNGWLDHGVTVTLA